MLLKTILAISALLATTIFGQAQQEQTPEQKEQMNKQMEALQRFLQQAESDGKADKPMMVREVDGKMVMEAIPDDVLANFHFPSEMDQEDL